jgi:hypothetical protein
VKSANRDAAGRATGNYTPKPSYYALQNLCAAFAADVSKAALPLHIRRSKEMDENSFINNLAAFPSRQDARPAITIKSPVVAYLFDG